MRAGRQSHRYLISTMRYSWKIFYDENCMTDKDEHNDRPEFRFTHSCAHS